MFHRANAGVGVRGAHVAWIAASLMLAHCGGAAEDGSQAGEAIGVAQEGETIDARTIVTLSGPPTSKAYWGLALDATNVYFTSSNTGDVYKVAKSGGTTSTLSSLGTAAPVALVLSGGDLYFPADGNCLDLSGIYSVPAGGGTTTNLNPTSCGSSDTSPSGIAIDATNLYWTDPNFDLVLRMPKGGGAVTTLASVPGADGVALSGTNLYVVGQDLTMVPTGGSSPIVLAGVGTTWGVTTDASHVYFTTGNAGTGEILSVPLGGGTVSTLASALAQRPFGITSDSKSLYWTGYEGDVFKMPKAGGTIATLARKQGHVIAIAVDANSVYFTNESDVKKITPK